MMGFWTKCFVSAVAAWITMYLLSKENVDIYPALLQNKNVIITGASSGLGEEAAYYCARSGASVVIAARRESLLKQVVSKCQELSTNPAAKFHYIVADISNIDESQKVISNAVTLLGSIDYLVLNHAYLLTNEKEISPWIGSKEQHELMRYSMDVNFISYMYMTDHAMPYLKKSNGSLTVVSSMITEHPAFSLPYAASKNALNAFFTGLRQEFLVSKENVSVTIMHLGFIQTDSSRSSLDSMTKAAKKDYNKFMSAFPPTSAAEGGQEIIRAAARREPYVYFPTVQKLWVLRALRPLLRDPDAFEVHIEKIILYIVDLKKLVGL